MTTGQLIDKARVSGKNLIVGIPLGAIVAGMLYFVVVTCNANARVAEMCPRLETVIVKQERLEATVVTRLEDIVRRLDRMERAADRRSGTE